MNKFKLNIYQSILEPKNWQGELMKRTFIDAINEIHKLSFLNLNIQNTEKSTIKVIPIKSLPTKHIKLWNTYKTYHKSIKEHYYKIIIEIEFKDFILDINEESKKNDNDLFLNYILPDDVFKRYMDFLMILNLCHIGAYNLGVGLFIAPLYKKRININSSFTRDLFEYSVEKKWPKFSSLDLTKTWNWFLNKVNPNGPDELSSSALGRAFNAYSYFYEESQDINKLFWTMLGLEAIYVKGKEGISEQLKIKGQKYLGEITEFKKRLTKMYDYRSSFIHGSKDFPSFFHHYDALESYENHSNELNEVLLTAQSMLIATLQKMSEDNRNELKFHYSLDDN